MPFAKKTESELGIIGIWEITESLSDLTNHFHFSEDEKKEFNLLGSEKRKREFLIIRLLTNEILGTKTELIYSDSGKPGLKNNEINISISHSEDLAAIFISKHKIGIDVESTQRNIKKIAERFVHESEWKFVDENKNSFIITLIWCAKEAIYKCADEKGLIFHKQITINPTAAFNEKMFFGRIETNNCHKSFKLWSFIYHNNIVVYCVEVENKDK